MAKSKKQPVILLDADFLIYSCGFAAQHTYYLAEHDERVLFTAKDMTEYKGLLVERLDGLPIEPSEVIRWERTVVEPVPNALHSVKLMINRMVDDIRERMEWFDPRLEVYLTGTGNFREKLATIKPYKGNRPPWARPRLYREIKQYLIEQWDAVVVHDMEADDQVAIRLTEEPIGNAVLAGIDKDLLQVPGYHYNPDKGMLKVSPQKGLVKLYRQILTGDPTDNIGGCYKCGAAAAKKIITADMNEPEMWKAVVDTYAESIVKYGEATGYAHLSPFAAAEENGHLIYMLRSKNDRFAPPFNDDIPFGD